MATAADLFESIEAMDLPSIASVSMAATEQEFADSQRRQLMQGKNAEGKRIGRYVRMKYARAKAQLNPLLAGIVPDNVDLRLTGAYHRGLKMNVTGQDYEIRSNDSKADDLEQKYGRNGAVLGLNDETKDEYVDGALQPAFEAQVEQATGLKFE